MGGALLLVGCASRGALRESPPPAAPAVASAPASPAPVRFEIDSEFGDESAWVAGYLDACARAFARRADASDLAPPESVQVRMTRDPDLGGIGGGAAMPDVELPDGREARRYLLFFQSDQWPEEGYRYWILAHELANLLAAHYAGGGGFPSDFWSDGRSPFPEYASCLLMRATGHPDEADWRRSVNADQPDHALYWQLDREHGFALFARFFRLLRHDGIVLGSIDEDEAEWPAPSQRRSLYAIAYLSIAAGENLAPDFRRIGVGREPADWKARHSEIPFREYEVPDADVADVMAARARLFGPDAPRSEEADARRERFRRGDGASD
jgi:hypothetical protein